MKKVWIFKFLSTILAKKNFNQTIQQRYSFSNGNKDTLPLKFWIVNLFWTILTKLCQILAKITENLNKNSRMFTKLYTSITTFKKRKSEKSFQFRILHWTGFSMIPLTILYDEYIDRPKLTEQKKNPVEYIVPPPH